MPGKRHPQRCRICKTRPPWKYKNCPPDVCKRCYHAHIWSQRPAARQRDVARADAADGRPREMDDFVPQDGSDRR